MADGAFQQRSEIRRRILHDDATTRPTSFTIGKHPKFALTLVLGPEKEGI
jgi:hypothetical protein